MKKTKGNTGMINIKSNIIKLFGIAPKVINYSDFPKPIKNTMSKNGAFFTGIGFAVAIYGSVTEVFLLLAGLFIILFGGFTVWETYYLCSRNKIFCINGECKEVVREGYRKQKKMLYIKNENKEVYKVSLPGNKGKYEPGDTIKVYSRSVPDYKDDNNCYIIFSFITIERIIAN